MVNHRAGVWKQQNKGHKTGRHRSKGQVEADNKGRRQSLKSLSRRVKQESGKINRRNSAKQIRAKKREEVLAQKRGLGGANSPPHIVAIIPLHSRANVQETIEQIKLYQQNENEAIIESDLKSAGFTINVPKLKRRYTFIQPSSANLSDVLDVVLVSNTVLFILSTDTEEPIDTTGRTFLSNIFSFGMSASVLTVNGLQKETSVKKLSVTKKSICKHLDKYFPSAKLHLTDTTQDVQLLLRTIGEQKCKPLMLRKKRPYMLANNVQFDATGDQNGELSVTGFVRNECLDVNRLVHIVGWGDFQIKRIDSAVHNLPPLINSSRNKSVVVEADMQSVETLAKYDPELRQDLATQADINPLDAEQTWPTEDEIKESEEAAKEASKVRKVSKKVPKGTSDYQAAWILDSDNDWSEDDEEDDSGSEMSHDDDLKPMEDADSQAGESGGEYEDNMSIAGTANMETASQYDDAMQFEDDMLQVKRYKEERTNEQFPDEVDTPVDCKARERFQKYRGLKSFRTSPWDANENLPIDYARIFQFKDFTRTRRRVRKLDIDDTVPIGSYVTVVIENVPKSFVESHAAGSPIILYGLFPHEQKMSVVHVALKRLPGLYDDLTIRSKDELLFHVGFRRFRVRPIFSEHTTGNKHKMERFFPKEGVIIASFYGQILFPPANILVFKEKRGDILPVACGSLYSVNPNRIITKRIVLSGHPFRVNKRSATVRYMFFNRDDVLWFKPVELRTKWGRRGHIKDVLGTHGHMKCVFDQQLISQDTVLMNLYKRVFPHWTYELITPDNRIKVHDNSSDRSSITDSKSRTVEFDEDFFM